MSLFFEWEYVITLSFFSSAISGKSDKEAQRRDSMVIQQARESMIAPPSSKPKPSLAAFGFASVEDVEK